MKNRYNSTFVDGERSSMLREWYRRGQATYRGTAYAKDLLNVLNNLLQGLSGTQREGFLMGWQSDAAAEAMGLELAFEGTAHAELDYDNRR